MDGIRPRISNVSCKDLTHYCRWCIININSCTSETCLLVCIQTLRNPSGFISCHPTGTLNTIWLRVPSEEKSEGYNTQWSFSVWPKFGEESSLFHHDTPAQSPHLTPILRDKLEQRPWAGPYYPTSVPSLINDLNGSESLQPGAEIWWEAWNQKSGAHSSRLTLLVSEWDAELSHLGGMFRCPHTFKCTVSDLS